MESELGTNRPIGKTPPKMKVASVSKVNAWQVSHIRGHWLWFEMCHFKRYKYVVQKKFHKALRRFIKK